MGQKQPLEPGIIVNHSECPIRYQITGTVQRLQSKSDSQVINTASSASLSASGGASGSVAGLNQQNMEKMVFNQVKGFVEVQPGRISSLGLHGLLPQRHSISIYIQPTNNPIRYFIQDVVINTVNEIRLKVMPSGAIKTMDIKEYHYQKSQCQKRHDIADSQSKKKRSYWNGLQKLQEIQLSKYYFGSSQSMILPESGNIVDLLRNLSVSSKVPVSQSLNDSPNNLSSKGPGNKQSLDLELILRSPIK